MESSANSDAVNGTPQKVAKPLSVMRDASGPSVERNGDRGETIEDIISELNATAKKNEPLDDAPTLGCLERETQPNRDSSDQWDRKTESMASSPRSIGEVATRSAAEPNSALTPVGGEGEVAVPRSDEVPLDGEKPAEATNSGTTGLGSQETSECSDGTGAVAEPELADKTDAVAGPELVDETGADPRPELADKTDAVAETVLVDETGAVARPGLADETGGKKPEERSPNLAEVVEAGEVTTSPCEIKAPDETVQSPRRTSRQRTVSKKLAESNTSSSSRMRRHSNEASGSSSAESSPVKRGAKQCLTSDSESEVPLAQMGKKILGSNDQATVAVKAKRQTSDSENDVPVVQGRRKILVSTKQLTVAAKTKRQTSGSESDTPLALKRLRTTSTDGRSTAALKVKKLASDSESDSPVAKRRSEPTKGPNVTTKGTERSQVKKASIVQSAEPPSKRKLIKRSERLSLETGERSKDNKQQDVQGSERSCIADTEAMNKKKMPTLASKTKRKAVQQKLIADSCGSTPGEQSLHEDHAKPDGASDIMEVKGNMSMLESALTTGSASSAVVNKEIKKGPNVKQLHKLNDNLNASNISTSGGSCAVGSGKQVSKLTSCAERVENVPAWSAHQFTESDRLLQESISLSLKNRESASSQFYLMVEVPSINARRMWGFGSTCRRPTVVFGGCDPVNTYVNVEGVRVPLHQWQQVSRITPTVRLRDIFRCLLSA